MGNFLKRLGEGSTWAGLAALAQVGANLLPQWAIYFHALTAAAGSIAAAVPDKGAQK